MCDYSHLVLQETSGQLVHFIEVQSSIEKHTQHKMSSNNIIDGTETNK